MTERIATTTGLFPLPDWAKNDLSDLKGHQKHDLISGDEGPELTAVYDDARAEVVAVQQDAGLDRIVEGQLRWDDMLAHPLTVHDTVETGGIVRYYDNNNFYRDPVVVDELAFRRRRRRRTGSRRRTRPTTYRPSFPARTRSPTSPPTSTTATTRSSSPPSRSSSRAKSTRSRASRPCSSSNPRSW